jgi:hypothetical protein
LRIVEFRASEGVGAHIVDEVVMAMKSEPESKTFSRKSVEANGLVGERLLSDENHGRRMGAAVGGTLL